MNKAFLFLACILFPAAAFAAEPDVVRVAYIESDIPAFMLDYAEPFFTERGIKVLPIKVQHKTTSMVLGGLAEVCITGVVPVVKGYGNGADFKVLAALFPRFDNYVLSRYGPGEGNKIKNMALLSSGGEAYMLMTYFLKHLGADPANIGILTSPSEAARYAMLEQGVADIMMYSSVDILKKARKEGKYHMFRDSDVGEKKYSPTLVTTSGKVLKGRSGQIERFLAGLYAGLKSAASDQARSVAFLKDKYGYSTEAAELFQADLAAGVNSMSWTPDGGFFSTVEEVIPEAPGLEKNKKDGVKVKESKRPISELAFPAHAVKARASVK